MMNQEHKKWDEMFRDAAGSFGAGPPASAWERISSGLDAAAGIRRTMWLRRSAAAAAVLLAFSVGYYFPGKKEKVIYVNNEATPLATVIPATVTNTKAEEAANTEVDENTQDNTTNTEEYRPTVHYTNYPGLQEQAQIQLAVTMPDSSDYAASPASSTIADQQEQSPSYQRSNLPKLHDSLKTKPVSPELLPPLLPPVAPLADASNPAKGKRVSWMIGALASPAYAYRNIENTPAEFSVMAENVSSDVNKNETAILSYAASLITAIEIGNRLRLQSGLQYSRLGQSSTQPLVQYRFGSGSRAFTSAGMVLFNEDGANEIGSKSFLASGGHYEGELLQQFNYMEIPLVASYKVIDKKLGLSVYAGLSGGILVGNNAYFIDAEGNKLLAGSTYDLNRFTYGGIAGIGLDYQLIKRFSISLAPGVKYNFSPINSYSTIGNHPYSFTVNTGLIYQLGKD